MTTYTYYGYPILAPVSITTNEPFFVSNSVSLKHQRVSQGAQRWELEFGIQYTGNDNSLFADIVLNQNNVDAMTMIQTIGVDRTSGVTLNPTVLSAVGVNNSTVPFVSTESGKTVAKGTFIQFSNHSKIYMIKVATSTNLTSFDVQIYPRLVVAVSGGETVLFPKTASPPQFNFFPDQQNLPGITYIDGAIAGLDKVRLIEAT